MPTATRTSVQERNDNILKDLIQWKKEDPTVSLQFLFKRISEKYDGMTFSNAQALYYTKFKPLLENDEETVKQQDNLKDTVEINNYEVRVIEYNEELYIVAKDLLKSIGIGSYSTHLNSVLHDENKALIPVKSTHGYAKTLVVKMDTCLEFLRLVGTEHKSTKIQQQAAINLRELRNYSNSIINRPFEKIENTQVTPLPTEEKEKETTNGEKNLYRHGEKVQFEIKHIGLKSVIGETKDGYKTHGTVYISDVTNSYIKDLHDYFVEGQVVLATVKHYDWHLKRLFLSTRDTVKPISIQTQKDESPRIGKSNVTITIKEQSENNDSHEITISTETEPALLTQKEEIVEVPTPTKEFPILSIKAQDELEDIIHLINDEARIGALSPEAKRKLIHLLNDNGLVKMISNIKDCASEFKPDLGLLFLTEVENKLKGEHL